MPQTATEPAPTPALVTSNPTDQVALRGVRLRCRVAGISARTTLEQTFVNLEARDIEALYTFPLPEGAAVAGFEVVFFDKVFSGVVEEADKAVEKYDDAIAEGHGAYLLEQHRPDVFSVRVGNLKPRQAVTIRLTYVQDLEVVDRSVRLAFPTTIAPRYVTSTGTDPVDAMIDGDALNPPHVLSVPYGLTAEVEIDLGKNLAGVSSPSHAITATRGALAEGAPSAAAPWLVSLATGIAEMNRDLVLALQLAKEQEPVALAATSDAGEKLLAVTFVPEFDEDDDLSAPPQAPETVFVLDCSGSMQGESIAQATAALECCLRAMSAGDTFNVCRFGSTFDLLSPEPLAYDQSTMARAIQYVRRGADLGGTELLPPLEAIFATKPARGQVRNIVLLTDGQVSNEPAVIALAKRKRSRNRLFTFGIGPACSQFLVKGLARVTGGAAEFITPGERIEEKVLRTFGRLSSPPVTDVEIEFGDADAEVAPKVIPPIFDGDAVRVFARLPGRLPANVTLRCNTAAGPRSWTVAVREARDAASLLPLFWARAMIRSLEDESAEPATSTAAATPQITRAVEISKRYGLLCSRTSFIAVEHRSLEDRASGQPALRRVPVMIAKDWGGVETGTGMMGMVAYCAAPAAAPMAPPAAAARAMPRPAPRAQASRAGAARGGAPGGPSMLKKLASRFLGRSRGGTVDPDAGWSEGSYSAGAGAGDRLDMCRESAEFEDADAGAELLDQIASETGAPEPSRDALVALLSLQAADGSFAPPRDADDLLRAAGKNATAVQEAIRRIANGPDVPSAVSAAVSHTLTALALFHLAFADRQATWKRAAQKATRYLAQAANADAAKVKAWLAQIEAAGRA